MGRRGSRGTVAAATSAKPAIHLQSKQERNEIDDTISATICKPHAEARRDIDEFIYKRLFARPSCRCLLTHSYVVVF